MRVNCRNVALRAACLPALLLLCSVCIFQWGSKVDLPGASGASSAQSVTDGPVSSMTGGRGVRCRGCIAQLL